MILLYDFTHVAVSNTATDDVTNEVTHTIFKQTYDILVIIYILKSYEKCSCTVGF